MAFAGRVEHPRFLELQQGGIVASLEISLDSGPIATDQTGLARIPSGDFLFAFDFQDCNDAEKAVRLSRYIPSILFSQRWTAKLDNRARRKAELL
jgi:hypothetical protein